MYKVIVLVKDREDAEDAVRIILEESSVAPVAVAFFPEELEDEVLEEAEG